jgi:DNA-binding transcriptional ArsR family regulator
MVKRHQSPLDPIFHALADPTRRAILARLSQQAATVGELSRPFEMSMAAVSKHLGILERADLITRETRGRERICTLKPQALAAAYAWLRCYEHFWTERLNALDDLRNEQRSQGL